MTQPKEWTAFVIMPFSDEFAPIYYDIVLPSLEEVGFIVTRADSPLGQQNILKSIVVSLDQSSLIVADLTGLNENVMYELGIAHALQKPTVMLTQNINELPFDLRSYKAIPYSLHFKEVPKLVDELKKVAEGLKNGDAIFSNPVSDFAPSVISHVREEILEQAGEVTLEEPSTWFDYVGEFHEQIQLVTEIASRLASLTTSFGNTMTLRGEQLNKFTASNISGSIAKAYPIFKAISQDMEVYATELENELPIFRNAWEGFSTNLENILTTSTVSTDEDVKAIVEFKGQLNSLQGNLQFATQSMSTLNDTVKNMPGISKHISRAAKKTESALDHLVEELLISDASITRINNVIDGLLPS